MRLKVLIPVVLVALVLIVVPLSVAFELPGEQSFKSAIGYPTGDGEPDCVTVDRGSGDAWKAVTRMPSRRDGPSAALVGSKVYLAGGIEGFSEGFELAKSTALVESYDVTTGRWERAPSLPRRLNHVNLAAWGGGLYALGGKLDDFLRGTTTTESWRLDLDTGRWEELPPIPTARSGAGVRVVNDRIYVVGGYARNIPVTAVESFDPRTRTWREHSPMPTARDHLGLAAHDGSLYAFGGRGANLDGLAVLERYDVERDAWERLPDGPYPPAGFTFEETPVGLVAAGGEFLSDQRLYGSVWSYLPEEGAWRRLPSMSPPKHGQGSAYVQGRLWVFGGSTCSGFAPVRSVESLRLPRA